MPFASYGSAAEVARRHDIRIARSPFVERVPFELSGHFLSELDFTLREVPFDGSESAACEALIYPLLREVWKPFHESLTLWSHQPLHYDDDLSGVPDFIVARRSPLGPFVFDQPYFIIVEAKKDDYLRGWGQCLAAMLAAQKLNGTTEQALYGIATNGRAWEFGKLDGDLFVQDINAFALSDLEDLAAAIHFILIQCRDEAARAPVPA